MGRNNYRNRITIPLPEELYNKIKVEAAEKEQSINEYAKAALIAFVDGKVYESAKELSGSPPSTACIYALDNAKDGCPLRKVNPHLQKPENIFALLKGCGPCHLRHAIIKGHTKAITKEYTNVARQFAVKDALTAKSVGQPFKCKNEGCSTMLTWVTTESGYKPFEVETGKQHHCQYWQQKTKSVEQTQELELTGKRVTCETCKESFSTHMKDTEALDRLLDTFSEHLVKQHQRTTLTEGEAKQFRTLREAPIS